MLRVVALGCNGATRPTNVLIMKISAHLANYLRTRPVVAYMKVLTLKTYRKSLCLQ